MKFHLLSIVISILTLFRVESLYALNTIATPFGLIPNHFSYYAEEDREKIKNREKPPRSISLSQGLHGDENGEQRLDTYFAYSTDRLYYNRVFYYPQLVIDVISELNNIDSREKERLFYAFIIIALRGLDGLGSLTTGHREYIHLLQITKESERFLLTVRPRNSDRTFTAYIYQSEISQNVHAFHVENTSYHIWRLYYCDGSDYASLVNVFQPTLSPQELEMSDADLFERAQTLMQSQAQRASCLTNLCRGIETFFSR